MTFKAMVKLCVSGWVVRVGSAGGWEGGRVGGWCVGSAGECVGGRVVCDS